MRRGDTIKNYLRFHEAMLDLKENCSRITHPFATIPRQIFVFVQALQQKLNKDRATCMPNPRRQRSL